MRWARIRSWHGIRRATAEGNLETLCGRTTPPTAETRETLPAGRSCESCLRIYGRTSDRT